MVAAARAFGAREPDASVRNPDYLAERFLGPAERQLIAEHPIAAALDADYEQSRQQMEVAGASNLMLARTRFIDDRLQTAIANGATQVVILGAGFDTRAYRFKDLLQGKTVFEVDYRSTQEFKKRRVEATLGHPPSNLTFVEIDFQRDKLDAVLRDARFQPGGKSFFVWEGVSMYLPESAVRETLRNFASLSGPGSSLVMDFATQAAIEMLAKLPWHPQHKFTTEWGEPWIFGIPDGRERAFFRECGLEVREILAFFGGDAGKRYLTRADGTRLGRGKPGQNYARRSSVLSRLATTMQLIGPIARMLMSRSKGYALAELVLLPRS